jgi:hypothetical protein
VKTKTSKGIIGSMCKYASVTGLDSSEFWILNCLAQKLDYSIRPSCCNM